MAFVQAVWFRFWWLLISLVCIQPKHVSSKAVDPQAGLICFAGNSLTRINTDGTKHIQPVQSWQPKLDHAPCSTHLTCDASVNGVHVPTSEGTAYAVRGQGAVFVVTQDSTVTSLALTIDLRDKNCNLSKLVNFPHGFLIECMMDGSRDPIRLIPVQYSGGKWAEKELVRVDVVQGKAVNQGVSAMLEVGGLQWYLFAQDNLLCSYDLVRGQRQCSPIAQDKCHHVAEILSIPGHTDVLIACTTGPGSLHITYVALYNTSSARVEKDNYPTGEFRAIHVSSSGDFTVFVDSRFITVVLTLDSSSSAQQKELPVSHGEVVLSLVSREMLLYTTKEAALKGLATYQTYAVDLSKAFHEGAPAERLEGDNCTVTERPGPGEWIVACSDALFWYRGSTADRVRITWLDGSAREQQCFASRPQFGPPNASISATVPATSSAAAPSDMAAVVPATSSAAVPSDMAAVVPATSSAAVPSDTATTGPATSSAAVPSDMAATAPATSSAAVASDVAATAPATSSAAVPSDAAATAPATSSAAVPSDVAATAPATSSAAVPSDAAATGPATSSAPSHSDIERLQTIAVVAIVFSLAAVVAIVALIAICVVLSSKLRNQQVKLKELPNRPDPEAGRPVGSPEDIDVDVDMEENRSLLRRGRTQSTTSTISRRHSLPLPIEMMTRRSLTSLEGTCGSSQPQNNTQTSQVTHTGTLRSGSETSLATAISSTSGMENEGRQLHGAASMCLTDTGAIIANPRDDNGQGDLAVELPVRSRDIFIRGNGARYPWHY